MRPICLTILSFLVATIAVAAPTTLPTDHTRQSPRSSSIKLAKVQKKKKSAKKRKQAKQRKRAKLRNGQSVMFKQKRFKVVKARRNRVSHHTAAYKKRHIVGGHFNIKITPPEMRGHEGFVGFEFYNFSKKYVSVADFYVTLITDDYMEYEARLTVENLKAGWSDIRWAKIPGKGYVPKIQRVEIERFQLFDNNGRRISLPYTTDLIKR